MAEDECFTSRHAVGRILLQETKPCHQHPSPTLLCFYAIGNICRSPIAEAVFKNLLAKLELEDKWSVDSAALIGYHVGKPPDERAMDVLRNHGITSYDHTVRLLTTDDFYQFDYIFGMDDSNMNELECRKPSEPVRVTCRLLGQFDPLHVRIIQDPYYMYGSEAFETVYEQCERCLQSFLNDTSL